MFFSKKARRLVKFISHSFLIHVLVLDYRVDQEMALLARLGAFRENDGSCEIVDWRSRKLRSRSFLESAESPYFRFVREACGFVLPGGAKSGPKGQKTLAEEIFPLPSQKHQPFLSFPFLSFSSALFNTLHLFSSFLSSSSLCSTIFFFFATGLVTRKPHYVT